MKQIEFKEQNATLGKPENMTDEECGSLPCHIDGVQVISKWKLNAEELIKIMQTGEIWLSVLSGKTQPPVAIWIGDFENKPKIG